jgi:hypothetical protein
MGAKRWALIVAVVAVTALPAIALAAVTKPAAGKWKVTVSGPLTNPKGSFKVTSDREHIKSFTVPLLSSEGGGGTCPTGTLTVPATLELKNHHGFWAYGNTTPGGGATERNVSAKLNGAPLANVRLLIILNEQARNTGYGYILIGKPGTPGCYYDLSLKH